MNTPRGDWFQVSVAAHLHGIPIEHIEQAIIDGHLQVRLAAGARVVLQHEVAALALTLRAGLCEGCADD